VENINHLADVRRGRAPHDAGMTDQRTTIDTDAAALVSSHQEQAPSTLYRRVGPAAGLAGLVLFAAGSLLAGLPGPNTRIAAVITHLTADRGAVLTGILLMFLALPGLLVFLGYLRSLLAGAEGPPAVLAATAAAAWLLLFAVIGIGLLPLAAVAWRGAAGLPPAVVRLCADMATLSLYALSAPAAAVSVLAPSAVIWRTRVLPRWLALFGLAEVAVNVVELTGLMTARGSDAAGYAAGIGPVLWTLWAAALCGCALAARRARRGS
jgi:hypothetical protein